MTSINVGDRAPDFHGIIQDGSTKSLSDYKDQGLILFFYPKDSTPGCTAEVCSLRDNYEQLIGMGYRLLGVSADTLRKHNNFINKYSLPFDLLADTQLKTIAAYDVWGPKKFMGKTYDGIHRTTFVLSPNHQIDHIVTKVKTKSHADQLIQLINSTK
ncbi:UNVERIFIED_CONTAM: hypothetical protein GTU68_000367 [Idotea baltica]|nr:hypothetical protein [Idotea baltica]